MPKITYTQEFKNKVLNYYWEGYPLRTTCHVFGVSMNSVITWQKQAINNNLVAKKSRKLKRGRRLKSKIKEELSNIQTDILQGKWSDEVTKYLMIASKWYKKKGMSTAQFMQFVYEQEKKKMQYR